MSLLVGATLTALRVTEPCFWSRGKTRETRAPPQNCVYGSINREKDPRPRCRQFRPSPARRVCPRKRADCGSGGRAAGCVCAAMSLPRTPASLAALAPYLDRAAELQASQPMAAHYIRVFAMQLALKLKQVAWARPPLPPPPRSAPAPSPAPPPLSPRAAACSAPPQLHLSCPSPSPPRRRTRTG